MKDIDPKSLIIGVLATALVFACTDSNKKNSASPSLVTEAKAATGKEDRGKWDNEQEWEITYRSGPSMRGWEPIGYSPGNGWIQRRRIK